MADEYQRSGKLKSQAGGNCHINLWEGGPLYDIYGGLVNTPTTGTPFDANLHNYR